ncbi:hypothetical protein J6590_071210 [Homalodisca vitripennis]|nr:hypothetical protein J6590_071210 [Homalodisca vitripennis]
MHTRNMDDALQGDRGSCLRARAHPEALTPPSHYEHTLSMTKNSAADIGHVRGRGATVWDMADTSQNLFAAADTLRNSIACKIYSNL